MKTEFLVTNEHLVIRPVQEGDAAFLFLVYASTRMDEMALVNWSDAQKAAFLRMQFDAQTIHYRSYYPQAEYQIIQREDGLPIGRVIIDRSNKFILLMDIALLPEFRNSGIGTTLMCDLLAEAAASNRPVRLHVEVFNRAMKMYERLGFVKCNEQGIYHEMIWNPGGDHS
jgi:ribosomal protein S18 acetylase RimI-like enzyme